MEKDIAILVRRTPLTETSLIVHWCAPRCGMVKTVAKGARNLKNRFHGKLDLFFEAEIEIVRSRRSDLHILKDLQVTDPHPGIRESYPKTLAAAYFVRFLEIVSERETPIPELHSLLRRALGYLDHSEPDLRALHHFEAELARALGIHQEGSQAPVEALRELFQRIPDQREELLGLLTPPSERPKKPDSP